MSAERSENGICSNRSQTGKQIISYADPWLSIKLFVCLLTLSVAGSVGISKIMVL